MGLMISICTDCILLIDIIPCNCCLDNHCSQLYNIPYVILLSKLYNCYYFKKLYMLAKVAIEQNARKALNYKYSQHSLSTITHAFQVYLGELLISDYHVSNNLSILQCSSSSSSSSSSSMNINCNKTTTPLHFQCFTVLRLHH